MSPHSLLHLYPRAWRERYADEFLAACGDDTLSFQQVIDILGGAIDARFAPQAHLAASNGGHTERVPMPAIMKEACASRASYTRQDAFKGAAVVVGGSLIFSLIAMFCYALRWNQAGRFFNALAFPASLILSNYFTFLKDMSPIARAVFIGATLLVIAAICMAAARL